MTPLVCRLGYYLFLCVSLAACGVRETVGQWQPDLRQQAEIAAAVGAYLNGDGAPDEPLLTGAPPLQVYAALWARGERLSHAWGSGMVDALQRTGAAPGIGGSTIDSVEISLSYGFRSLDPSALGDDLSAVHRGVRGVQVRYGERTVRFAPSQMVAENLSFERALASAARMLNLDGEGLLKEAQLATFEAAQLIMELTDNGQVTITPLLRGNRLLTQPMVSRDSLGELAGLMQQWMIANLHPDGRMTYLYYPSSGKESSANNMIRQWMATLCLTRMGLAANDPNLLALALSSIRFNLDAFYTEEDGLGLIEYRNKVKLGAIALAALAILEHPQRDAFGTELSALVATTDKLWREDGSFQTFYRPAERSAEPNLHNFYPGETLLLWATLLQHEADVNRVQRFMRSFEYYRQWHRENRKPAFIPWHTQAYYLEWQRTGNPALRDWIFEMNDWLLTMQVNSRLGYDDTLGRFYDPAPERSHFGPPHASSTGVYLEGLIDAYQLALSEGDQSRSAAYARSMELGLRSAMQLQFRDDASAWFVSDRQRVTGGLRTTVYNNVIRVDNVQHTLMAVLKMQKHLASQPDSLLLATAR